MLFFLTIFVVSFGYIFASSPTAAAADATWNDGNLTYNSDRYTPFDRASAKGLDAIPLDTQIYRAIEQSNGEQTAQFIYFKGEDVPKSVKQASYITYTLNPPNDYSSASSTETITVTPSSETNTSTSKGTSSCAVDNVGWLVCGAGGWIASGIDAIYGLFTDLLRVAPLSGGNNSLYRIWNVMRDFANIMFIIGFMVVIYSYLVGGGFSNYEIKRIIPRLVLAAILINISYWIVALAVDLSNIIGMGLQDMMIGIRETAVGTEVNRNVGWEEITTYVLSGGAIGGIAFLAATGGSVASLSFMLIGILIVVVFSLFVAFVILAARQAIIIVLVALAPLAFAAYILPNTEKWFDRWRSVLTTMLMLFPIFSLLFGGSQLASAIIVQNATNLAVMLFGMAVQIIPLIITPFLIQFSGGLIGRIAGVVNNAEKGLLDRGKNWANDRSEFYKDRALASNPGRFGIARRGGQRMYAKGVARKKQRETYQKEAENRAHEREFGTGAIANSRLGQAVGAPAYLNRNSYGTWDQKYREADQRHHEIEGHHEEHWKKRINDEPDLLRRQMNIQNSQDAATEADTVFKRTAANAKTFRTLDASDSASVRQEKLDHNAVLTGIGLTEAQLLKATQTAQSIAVESAAVTRAEGVAQGQLANLYNSGNKVRSSDLQTAIERAGGIDPNGQTKVQAQATNALTKMHMENVEAVNSIFSNDGYDLKELFQVVQQHKLRGGKKADDMHVHAAIQQILSEKGNNWAAQKLHDYTEATQKINRDASGNIIDTPEEASRKRDFQQIYRDSHLKSGLKLTFSSGTDKGELTTGDMRVKGARPDGAQWNNMSEYSIYRDIRDNKIKADRVARMDVDELQRMVQVLRDPGIRDAFSDKQRETVLGAINEAKTNASLSGLFSDREGDLMGVIGAYLDKSDTRSAADKESIVIEPNGTQRAIEIRAPNDYDYMY